MYREKENKMEGEDEMQERHFAEEQQSPTVLPWDQFSNWIHCCCVVTFDLELGQAMEVHFLCISLIDIKLLASENTDKILLSSRSRSIE